MRVATSCILLLVVVLPVAAQPPKAEFTAEALAFYDKEVLPLLKTACLKCHGETKFKGGFSLASREAIIRGGDLGAGVDLQKPENSHLLKAVNYRDGLEMPPTGKLKPAEIDVLTRWVKAGLPMRDSGVVVPKHEPKGGIVNAEAKNYWAFKPVVKPALPKVANGAWASTPLDAFILAKLEAKKITPNPVADRVALVRRVYYDLLGLPPTPEQVDAFVNDKNPNAYEALLDELLKSPHYGEKWGRYWLDIVRYAETNGYERDGPKPYAWRYRDYVIQSFNNDKPYDRFVREQLAGDEMPGENPEAIIATGFYRLGLWDDEPADPMQATFDEYDDIVATTSQAFLGLTMNCARCHDHKIDPIPQKDYYSMLAFFRDIRRFSNDRNVRSASNLTDITPPMIRVTYDAELQERKAKIEAISKKMTAIENEAIKKMPAEDQRASEGIDRPQVVRKVPQYLDGQQKMEYAQLKKEREALEKKPNPSQELALSVNNCNVRPPQTYVLIRGNAHAQGAAVEPAFPEVLGYPAPKFAIPAKNAKSSGRRTVLADWITDPKNPLTARVFVNRVWQGHFGRGIVTSSSDFGKFGTGSTHPELLDYLADDFVQSGWKIKRLHKQIMLSKTYQQTATTTAETLRADPGNMLFGRFGMRRLGAEEVRDSVLFASGQLNLKAGGPSVYPAIPKEVLAGQSVPGSGWPTSPVVEGNRRSVYVHVKRSLQVPVLAQYDQADTDSSCPIRYTTTVPTQALGMLNGEFTNDAAKAFAKRLQSEAPTLEAQVRRAIRLTTGRAPTAEEVAKDVAFVQELKNKIKLNDADALRQYCLLVLNTNEFVYVD